MLHGHEADAKGHDAAEEAGEHGRGRLEAQPRRGLDRRSRALLGGEAREVGEEVRSGEPDEAEDHGVDDGERDAILPEGPAQAARAGDAVEVRCEEVEHLRVPSLVRGRTAGQRVRAPASR